MRCWVCLEASSAYIVGMLLAGIISGIGIDMPPPPGSNIGYIATIRLIPELLAIATLTGVLATVIAAVLPARRTSRLAIVDALRQNV